MKKYTLFFIFIFLWSVGMGASPSGLLEDYTHGPEAPGYGLVKVLSGQPIRYVLQEGTKRKPKKGKRPEYATSVLTEGISSRAAIIEGFNKWFFYTKQEIEKAGRSAEFADIMPILSKAVSAQQISSEEEADIVFFFSTIEEVSEQCKGTGAAGCHWGKQIILPYMEYTQAGEDDWDDVGATLVHEIGHFWGLSDEYASAHNKSREYSTSGRTNKHLSIMDIHDAMGCDDVDGFINAIDFSLAYKNGGRWSERAQKGWKSFCDNTMFAKGKQLDKPDETAEQCVYRFKHDGTVARKMCPEPFVFGDRKVVFDAHGAPLRLEDWDLNMAVYYSTWFDRKGEEPFVNAEVKSLDGKKRILNLQAKRDADTGAWDFPYQEDRISVHISDAGCGLFQGSNLGALESGWIQLDRHGKISELSYSLNFLSNKKYTGANKSLFSQKGIYVDIEGREDANGPWNCSVLLNYEKILSYDENERVIFSDDRQVQNMANRYHVSAADIVAAGAKSCSRQRLVNSYKWNELKQLCRMASRFEHLYQNRR